MSVQLFAQLQGSTEYVNLSLFDADPVKLTLSVTSIQDPLAATSVFSRTFRVPHNSINGPYFKGVFNVNSTDFDAAIKSDAYILDNGQLFTRGNIRLINVYNSNSDGSVEYEILFTGETSDFGAKIGGGFLNELDFTEYNHERTLFNIQKSWNLDLFSGDLVYGLIEWGYTYDKNNRPDIPTLSNGFEKSFTNVSNPLLTSQWKPQFRAKAIWDKVFENVNYTYDSDFLNSELFKKMYVITENKAEGAVSNANGAEARSNYTQYLTVGNTNVVQFGTEVTDNGNNYDPGTSTYNVPATGSYTASIILNVGSGSNSGSQNYSIAGSVSVVDANTNQTLASVGYYINTASPQTISNTLSFAASVGQQVVIKINSTCATGSGCSNGITDLRIYSGNLIYTTQSNIFSINSIMPNNVRTIDFMRSIINRFRLVFVPSKEIENHFTITPWKDWILQGQAIDWTNKVNGDIDAKSSPIFYTQNRFNIFKDQEDSDYLNYDYQLQYKQTFGQLNLDSANELITGTKTYQDQFAAAPLAPIGFKEGDTEAPKFVIPHIAKDTGASQDTATGSPIVGKREPVQPKLRLVFYNGIRQAPLTWYSRDYSGGAQAQTTYPLMSQYSEFPVTPTTLDLCWANVAPYWDTEISILGTGKTSNTCFTTYWKSWYDTTFDPYSRIIELEVQLDYSDLINFRFNDYVFIQDSWYFVNEVKDYIVGQNTLCKVQLIKVGNNIGITLPLVVENQLTEIILCKAATACDAYCCKDYTGATSNTYWINGTDLFDSNAIYIDNAGSQYAPAGIYSDGMTAIELNGFGAVASRPDISACDCTPTTYSYTVEKVTTTPCDLYCKTNPTVVVYSTSSAFVDSTYFFLDAALTIPAPVGYYAPVGGLTSLQVGANGQVLVTVSLADCNCVTYYPHVTCYSGALCDACCCYNQPTTVWTNNTSLSTSTQIWLDNVGTTPAPIGYYKETNTEVARVTTAGLINGIDTCNSCSACEAGPVQVTFGIGGSEPGYTSTVVLEKSFDNITWIEVGSLTFTAGGDIQDTIGLEEGVYVRATFTSTVNGGQLYSYYYVNGQTVFYNINDTPGSRTIYSTGTITAANLYQLSGYVSGGIPVPNDDLLLVSGRFVTYQGNTQEYFVGLNNDATVNTSINYFTGFSQNGGLATFASVIRIGDIIVITGTFNQFFGSAIPANRVALNMDGSVNATFNTNLPTGLTSGSEYRLTYIDETKFALWKYGSAGILSIIDNTGTTLYTVNGSSNGFNSGVNNIAYYNNQLVIAGNFTTYTSPNNVTTAKNKLIKLDLTLEAVSGFNTGTGPNVSPNDIAVTNTKIYIAANAFTPSYNGTSTPGKVYAINHDGSLDTTFLSNIGSGFSVSADSADEIQVDADGIWLVGDFDIWQGTSGRYRVIRLNLDGTYNSTFVNSTDFGPIGPSTNLWSARLYGNDLYVWGSFDDYKGSQEDGLIKLNKLTGAVDTTFAVGTGFDTVPNGTYKVRDLFKTTTVEPPTLYAINVFKSTSGACQSYCGTPNVIVYGDNTSLVNSTILYQDSNGTTPVTQGWYSDNITIVYVLSSDGVITDRPSASGCNCNTLNYYSLNYNSSSACLSCSSGASAVGWIVEPNWGSASLVYGDASGSTFVAPGYYNSNLGTINQVGSNGVVVSQSDCIDCNLNPNCAEYHIVNYGSQTFNYSYVDCNGMYHSGTLYAGTQIVTQCMNLQDFSATMSTWLVTSTYYC